MLENSQEADLNIEKTVTFGIGGWLYDKYRQAQSLMMFWSQELFRLPASMLTYIHVE